MPTKRVAAKSVRERTSNWTNGLDETMLRILKQEYTLGNYVGGQFTNDAWTQIVATFNLQTGLTYTKAHIKNRLKVLKKSFLLYHTLATKSGWGWDPDRNMLIVGDLSDWEDMIEANPQYAKCKDRPFPAFGILELLCASTSIGKHQDKTTLDIRCRDNSSNTSHDISSSSSHGKRKRTGVFRPTLEPVETARWRSRITKEQLNCENAARPRVYSIEDCIDKLETVPNISSEAFLSACEAFKDENDRSIFMRLNGSLLNMWIDRQVAKHTISVVQVVVPSQQNSP
ncbi:L10-interacting MYB domain-containing protein [Elaeis guineensis]|uniref:L10-interacting MYB domain-containing protein n=1 Tax=Elaeis guineensis var. tenera TaxID=51953 RepID=A0A6J0PEW8_ELAGV|nr:L10-interacting MYB domain-containing protein [Elaeis guineensis]